MPQVFSISQLELSKRNVPVEEYNWDTTQRLSNTVSAKNLIFDIRKLHAGKYSFAYHFHHNSEELFYIIDGEATLRTNKGTRIVKQGDIVFCEIGAEGAHQLYNHSDKDCLYLDLRTNIGIDIAEYPDSNKMMLLPQYEMMDKSPQVPYYKGEENPAEIWKNLKSED
jgi:uncharacterized cupin superfamily protein